MNRFFSFLLALLLGVAACLPATTPAAAADSSKAVASSGQPELLDPDVAFAFSARGLDDGRVELRYRIAPGYYLYRDRFRFAAEPAGGIFGGGGALPTLGTATFPKGLVHKDEFFGETEIYRGELVLHLPAAGAERFRLAVTSQGCADVGVCYIPHTQRADIRMAASSSLPAAPSLTQGSPRDTGFQSEDARFFERLNDGRILTAVVVFFLAGIALTFTPCVLPMIPILSGIIAGERAGRRHGFMLSLAYVLGMAITYTGIGIAAAMSGQLLSAALQSPWVLVGFALVFVALALSMMDVWSFSPPAALNDAMHALTQRLPGGRYAGVAVMGMLSAAIVSPCVAAPLAGALLYIGQTRDVTLGGAALFSMALGMGVPLMLVGATGGALLPRAGAWMNAVKQVFGVLMLGVALWIVSPLLPAVAQMLAWGVLALAAAVHLRAFDALPSNASRSTRFGRVAGVVLALAGFAQLLGVMSGGRDPLFPLSEAIAARGAAPGVQARAGEETHFERVRSVAELDARLASAGRPVMLDFYADWCVSCKEMERFTFTEAGVRERMQSMLLLQVDVTGNTDEDRALLKRFRLFGPPGIVFFDRNGGEIAGLRVIGYQNAARFTQSLDLALGSSQAGS